MTGLRALTKLSLPRPYAASTIFNLEDVLVRRLAFSSAGGPGSLSIALSSPGVCVRATYAAPLQTLEAAGSRSGTFPSFARRRT